MVQQKNGPDCAAVLRAMLHATTSYETEAKVIIYGVHMLPCLNPNYSSPSMAVSFMMTTFWQHTIMLAYSQMRMPTATYTIDTEAVSNLSLPN